MGVKISNLYVHFDRIFFHSNRINRFAFILRNPFDEDIFIIWQEVRRLIAENMNPMDFLEPECSQKVYSIMKSIFQVKMTHRPSFLQLFEQFGILLKVRRDPSPFRTQRRRVDSIPSTQERLPNNSPKSSSPFLAFPKDRSFRNASTPDLHSTSSPQPIPGRQTLARGFDKNRQELSPTTSFMTDRRPSEIPDTMKFPASKNTPDFLNVWNGNVPRRAGSFNNISDLKVLQNQNLGLSQQLLKDYVPNRFVHRKLL